MAVTLGSSGVTFGDGTSQTSTSNLDKGQPISITTYTSGTNTYTVPYGCTRIVVQLVGGGGGSAGYCESGGAGGFAEGTFNVTAGSTYTVTIGGGGGGVGYYAAGGNGGTSSFGALLSASGGYGSNQNYSHSGGHGGVGSGGQINLYGGSGTGHCNGGSHSQTGTGGTGFFGGGGGQYRATTGSNYSPAPGSGAAGGVTEATNSGATGASGLCVVYAYK